MISFLYFPFICVSSVFPFSFSFLFLFYRCIHAWVTCLVVGRHYCRSIVVDQKAQRIESSKDPEMKAENR